LVTGITDENFNGFLGFVFFLAVPVASPSGDEYLLVATKNSAGGSMELDASAGTAIDLFRI